jgi:hypothetical protein
VIEATSSTAIPFLEKLDSLFVRQFAVQGDLIANNYFGVKEKRASWLINNKAFFDSWRERAVPTYLAHNEMVKRVTPAERLHILRLEDGWEPLCKFLGKDVPEVPFPRVNESAAIKEKVDLYLAVSYKRSVLQMANQGVPLVLLMGCAFCLWLWWHLDH